MQCLKGLHQNFALRERDAEVTPRQSRKHLSPYGDNYAASGLSEKMGWDEMTAQVSTQLAIRYSEGAV